MKKLLTYSIVVATIVWSLGIAAVVPASAATPADGTVIKAQGGVDIYYVEAGQKHRFLNPTVLKSWYFKSDAASSAGVDFAKVNVQTVSVADFNALPTGGDVTVRPGTFMIQFGLNTAIYAVGPNAELYKVTNPATAASLFGSNWGKKVVVFPSNYNNVNRYGPVAGTLSGSSLLPAGTLVKFTGDDNTYVITSAGKQVISAEGFIANGLSSAFVKTATNPGAYATVSGSITTKVASLTTRALTAAGGTGVVTGALTASLSSDTPSSRDIPTNVSAEFLRLNFTAGSDSSVTINGIKLSAHGLGTATEIDSVTVYNNGKRFGNSRDIDSNKVAQINFTTPLVVAPGTTQTVVVKAQVSGTGKYALGLNSASDVSATGSVGGTFPIVGNSMSGVAVTVADLTIATDGSLTAPKLGDVQATLAKFKVTNDNVEDVTFKSITLKRDSASTASDDDVANLKLYMDGAEVATGGSISGRYVTFTLSNPVTILKNQVKRFTVKGDVVDGAGKALTLVLDSGADVVATGNFYGYQTIVTNSLTTGTSTGNFLAGAVTITKVNAANNKLKADTTNADFGTFKVTVNSGKTVELRTLKLTVASTNDPGGHQIETMTVLVKNTNTTYDMTSSTNNGVYKNADMGLILNSGTTYELQVRANVKSTATNGDYTVSISNAATDMLMYETANDTVVSDITPNSVSLGKVTVDTASLTFSKNALSATYSAVVGAQDVEALNFNIAAGQSTGVKITSLTFLDANSTATKAIISQFKLWKGSTLIKTVSANDISSYAIAFNDLSEVVSAGTTNVYKLTYDLVNDSNQNGKKLKYRLSAYSAEDTDKGAALYDSTAENVSANGVIAAGETGATSLLSAREVTVAGAGTMTVAVDNTIAGTNFASYQIAGTQGVALGSFNFQPNNEHVLVKTLAVHSSADMSSVINKLYLVNPAGQTVAWTTTISSATSTMDQDFEVGAVGVYTLKADLNNIGQNQAGLVDKSATFNIQPTDAEGVNSGQVVTVGNSGSSLNTSVVASKIVSVSFADSASGVTRDTSISSGVAGNSAIIKVDVPAATGNNNDDGSALSLAISRVKLAIETNVASITGATIQRIGGSGTATSSFTTTTSYVSFQNLSGADYSITPGTSAYFLVRLTTTFATPTIAGQYHLKINLDNLNGSDGDNDAGGSNFSWIGRSDETVKYDLRIPATTSITGTEIRS